MAFKCAPRVEAQQEQPPYSITFYNESDVPLFTYHVSRKTRSDDIHPLSIGAAKFSISIDEKQMQHFDEVPTVKSKTHENATGSQDDKGLIKNDDSAIECSVNNPQSPMDVDNGLARDYRISSNVYRIDCRSGLFTKLDAGRDGDSILQRGRHQDSENDRIDAHSRNMISIQVLLDDHRVSTRRSRNRLRRRCRSASPSPTLSDSRCSEYSLDSSITTDTMTLSSKSDYSMEGGRSSSNSCSSSTDDTSSSHTSGGFDMVTEISINTHRRKRGNHEQETEFQYDESQNESVLLDTTNKKLFPEMVSVGPPYCKRKKFTCCRRNRSPIKID